VKGVEAGRVSGNQVGQIQLKWTRLAAGDEQLRDLRFGETTCQAHDTPIFFLNDADPAIHDQDVFARLKPKNGWIRSTPLTAARARLVHTNGETRDVDNDQDHDRP